MFASVHTSTFAIGRVQSRGTLGRMVDSLRQAYSAHRERQALLALDDLRLLDLGLTRADVAAELSRSLWDAPRSWRA